MGLKYTYSSLDAVPELARDHYKEREDGTARLVVEDDPTPEAAALHAELRAEREAHKKTRGLAKLLDGCEEEAEGYIEERRTEVRAELEAAKAEHAALKVTLGDLKVRANKNLVRDAVREAAKDLPIEESAIGDAELLALSGELRVHLDGSIDDRMGLSVQAWLSSALEERPHWARRTRRAGERTQRRIFTKN